MVCLGGGVGCWVPLRGCVGGVFGWGCWVLGTSEGLQTGMGVLRGTQGTGTLRLGTLHDVEHPPQHAAGQGAVGHLRHEEPDTQPRRGEERRGEERSGVF